MSKKNRFIIHAIFWILSISLNIYAWSWEYYHGQIEWVYNVMLSHLSTILYFYVNYFILVPLFLTEKKYWKFGFFTFTNSIIHVLACVYFWHQYHFDFENTPLSQYGSMVYECMFYGFVSTGLKIMENWSHSENNMQILENELKKTELLFLQSQMSPHFLFNTLNNIYGLSLNNSPKTSKAISQLNDLMHYFQYFEKEEKVLMSNEIEFLDAYIALQILRNNANVLFEKQTNQDLHNLFIEPMLLLPFIENAFKHGDLNKNINIRLTVENNVANFQIQNQTNISKRKDAIGGIGVKNIERRLELLYPNLHQIEILEQEKTFSLNLKINLA